MSQHPLYEAYWINCLLVYVKFSWQLLFCKLFSSAKFGWSCESYELKTSQLSCSVASRGFQVVVAIVRSHVKCPACLITVGGLSQTREILFGALLFTALVAKLCSFVCLYDCIKVTCSTSFNHRTIMFSLCCMFYCTQINNFPNERGCNLWCDDVFVVQTGRVSPCWD